MFYWKVYTSASAFVIQLLLVTFYHLPNSRGFQETVTAILHNHLEMSYWHNFILYSDHFFQLLNICPVIDIAPYIWITFRSGFKTKTSNQERINTYFPYLSSTKNADTAIPAVISNAIYPFSLQCYSWCTQTVGCRTTYCPTGFPSHIMILSSVPFFHFFVLFVDNSSHPVSALSQAQKYSYFGTKSYTWLSQLVYSGSERVKLVESDVLWL